MWSAISKEEGGIFSGMRQCYVAVLGVVNCSITGPWSVWSAVLKEEGGIVSSM